MKILGLTGLKGSGKSTASSILKKEYHEVIEVALASHLKNVCSEVLDIPRDLFDARDKKEKELDTFVHFNVHTITSILNKFDILEVPKSKISPHLGVVLKTPRQVAQYVGTEILRLESPNIHCATLFKTMEPGKTYIVSDIRFPNELEYFSLKPNVTFKCFHIKNPAAELYSKNKDMHASESLVLETAKKAVTIDNSGSIDLFRKNILKAVSSFMESSYGKQTN